MSAAVLTLEQPALAAGDRFELTDEARRKLQPRNKTAGRIVADLGEFWKCRFDGQVFNRTVAKAYLRPERTEETIDR